MTDREAVIALAAPPPEPFRQVAFSHADYRRWDEWNRLRIEALAHVREAK